MPRYIGQQQAVDAARGTARSIINIPAALRLSIGFAVDPRVQPSHFNAPGRELAASPDFHALHVLCRLAAHDGIIAGHRRLSDNRVLVELIELGIEASKQKEKAFFERAERFRASKDSEEAKQLGDRLGRFVFGG